MNRGGQPCFKFGVETPGESLNLSGGNSLIRNQMLQSVRARPDDEIRFPERSTARPSQWLPHFDSVCEYDGAKTSGNGFASPKQWEPDVDARQSPGMDCGRRRASRQK